MSVNRIFTGSGHKFIYDFETLKKLLELNKFKNVQRLTFGKGQDQNLLIDSESRKIESLYVEAIKY